MITQYLILKDIFPTETSGGSISGGYATLASNLFHFLKFFNLDFCQKYSLEKKHLTMRDVLAIMNFIIQTKRNKPESNIFSIYVESIQVVVIESLGFLGFPQQ